MPVLAAWELSETTPMRTAPSAAALRSFRRHHPPLACKLSEQMVVYRCFQDDEALLEALLSHPSNAATLPMDDLTRICQNCAHHQLAVLSEVVPSAVATILRSASADMCLWAAMALPVLVVPDGETGFHLHLIGAPAESFGSTSWTQARAAVTDDLSLVDAYPSCDPQYPSVRKSLIALGPMGASHATQSDLPQLLEWGASGTLSRDEKVSWLRGMLKLVVDRVGPAQDQLETIGSRWVLEAPEDNKIMEVALDVLVAAKAGYRTLERIAGVVRSRDKAQQAMLMVTPDEASHSMPQGLLEMVLASSSLSSAAAARLLSCAAPHMATLAALAVQGSELIHASCDDHPHLQVCYAAPKLSFLQQHELLTALLDTERPKLPAEGSPKGVPHQRHLRFWLCVGSLVSVNVEFAVGAVAAVEDALRAQRQPLPATRVILQNVWARAIWVSLVNVDDAGEAPPALQRLVTLLQDYSLPVALVTPLIAVAAQVPKCTLADPT